MAGSAVKALQKSLVAGDQSLTQMLRQTELIAAKLNLEDVEKWVDYELKGYPAEVDPPPYREVATSHLEVRNPVRGWEFVGHLTRKIKARQPAPELEHLSKGGTLAISVRKNFPISDGTGGSFGSDWPQRMALDGAQFKHILEAVKDELLQWMIELEKRGIMGEDMDFGKEEQRSAAHQVFNIQKFTGVFGNVTNSTVALYDYSSIHQVLKERNIPQDQRNELENIFDELKTAAPEKKKSLLERGMAWVSLHKDFLGDTAEIVRKALGA